MTTLSPKQQRFYVYVIAIDGKVVYIGKGCGGRYKTHLRNSHNRVLNEKLVRAKLYQQKVEARIIKSGLQEDVALALEARLIGLRPNSLTNRSRNRPDALIAMAEAYDELAYYLPERPTDHIKKFSIVSRADLREAAYGIMRACWEQLKAAGYSWEYVEKELKAA